MSLAGIIRDVLVESVAAAGAMVVKRFLDEDPSAAEKAAAGRRLAKQAFDLLSDEDLYAFLTKEHVGAAEVIFRAAKAAKLAGKR